MKKSILFIALACFGLTVNSCNKVTEQLAQAIGWDGVDVTIDVPPVTDTMLHGSIGTGTFTYNIDSMVNAASKGLLSLKNVSKFNFKSCTLTILNPDADNNFQNFQLAQAVFFTNANATSTNMGEIDNNPDVYAASLNVPVNTTTNLKSYLPASGPIVVTYVMGGKFRKVTTTTLHVNVHVTYNIQ